MRQLTCLSMLLLSVSCADSGSTSKPPEAAKAKPAPAESPEPAQAAEATKPRRTGLVSVGVPAPVFAAEAHDGSKLTLSELKGSPIVLYFYPKDETPG